MDAVVSEDQSDVTFLYTLVKGVCSKSFGMNVAKLAGIAPEVIHRAEVSAKELEENSASSQQVSQF